MPWSYEASSTYTVQCDVACKLQAMHTFSKKIHKNRPYRCSFSCSSFETQSGSKQTRQIYVAKQAGRHTHTIKLIEAN